jgi:hypothetical protein
MYEAVITAVTISEAIGSKLCHTIQTTRKRKRRRSAVSDIINLLERGFVT